MRLCAAVSTCIVGVRDGCRLRARRLIKKYCLRIVLSSGITGGIIVKDGKVGYLCRCDEHFMRCKLALLLIVLL